MKKLVARLFVDDRGQDLIEYALLATFVSLAGIAGVGALTSAITNVFSTLALQLE